MTERFRIKLGTKKTQAKEGKRPHIMKHRAPAKNLLNIIDNKKDKSIDVRKECKEVRKKLKECSFPLEEGPYADKDLSVATLATSIRELAEKEETGTEALIDKVIDIIGLGKGLPIVVDNYLHRESDDIVTAGLILTEKERRKKNESDGSEELALDIYLEKQILAAAVLRRMGLEAYPAFSVLSGDGENELTIQIIAVLEAEKDAPLITFHLGVKEHPPIGAVDLMSDEEVVGANYASLAGNMIKRLARRMVETVTDEQRMLSEEEREAYLEESVRLFYECSLRCDYPGFTTRFIGHLHPDNEERMMREAHFMLPAELDIAADQLGVFKIIYGAFQQCTLAEIQNTADPDNIPHILNEPELLIKTQRDGLILAVDCRRTVRKRFIELAGRQEGGLN